MCVRNVLGIRVLIVWDLFTNNFECVFLLCVVLKPCLERNVERGLLIKKITKFLFGD